MASSRHETNLRADQTTNTGRVVACCPPPYGLLRRSTCSRYASTASDIVNRLGSGLSPARDTFAARRASLSELSGYLPTVFSRRPADNAAAFAGETAPDVAEPLPVSDRYRLDNERALAGFYRDLERRSDDPAAR